MAGRTAALIAGAAGGSIITYLLAHVAEARAAGPPAGVDPATWEMYLNTMEATAVQAEQVQALTVTLNNLVVTLGGTPTIEVEDPFENTRIGITGQLICPVIGMGYRLPPIPIPKNKQLVVKGLPLNTGYVYVAFSQADVQNWLVGYPLFANEGIGYAIQNANAIWVSADTLNEGVAFTVEQD